VSATLPPTGAGRVSATLPPTGAVYDRGYRPYEGERGGRGASRAALLRVSIRRALGLRRSWRQKVLPWSLLAIAAIPAVVNVGLKYITRNTPAAGVDLITFREYVGVSTTLLLFVAITAPDMICPDRRNRVLPLIFARPLTGNDYAFAKVGALAAIVFGFGFLPQVVLFVGQMLVVQEGALAFVRENAAVLWQVPVAVALFALFWASLALAISATTTRRVVAGVALLATVLVSGAVASILVAAAAGTATESIFENGSLWGLLSVVDLPLRMTDLVFLGHVDPGSLVGGAAGAGVGVVLTYVAIVSGSLGYLLYRYRGVG
jgi:ABC-2 type transport system permease protein